MSECTLFTSSLRPVVAAAIGVNEVDGIVDDVDDGAFPVVAIMNNNHPLMVMMMMALRPYYNAFNIFLIMLIVPII